MPLSNQSYALQVTMSLGFEYFIWIRNVVIRLIENKYGFISYVFLAVMYAPIS